MTHPELIERICGRFEHPRFALFTEVGNAVGFARSRADAIAMAMWRSLGLEVHGFEIKCSRGDWLREKRAPFKAEDLFSYCDRWWLVVADSTIIKDGELPPQWGLLAPHGMGLEVKVKPEKLNPRPLDREFVAAILRKATKADRQPFRMMQRMKSSGEEIRALLQNMQSDLTRFETKLERLRFRVQHARAELSGPEPTAITRQDEDFVPS